VKFQLDDSMAVLARRPATLDALLRGLPPAWLEANEGPDTFSPRDVLGHLILGERTDWVPRLKLILGAGEAVPFTPFDRFGFKAESQDASIPELLERFSTLREENLDEVQALALDEPALARTGRHPGLGRVTLEQLLAAWVVHDLGHVKQIVRVMARQYREAIGPWREYLTIVDRP
jgi:hypothetical protein